MAGAFGTPWIVNVDGEEIQFPLLKVRQIATLQAALKADHVAAARKYAVDQKVKPEAVVSFLSRVEQECIDLVAVRVWAQGSGTIRVLEESLAGGSREEAAVKKANDAIDKLTPNVAVEAALRVTGWTPGETLDLGDCLKSGGWIVPEKADMAKAEAALAALGVVPMFPKVKEANPSSAAAP